MSALVHGPNLVQRLARFTALLVPAVLLAAACGGDDDSGASTSAPGSETTAASTAPATSEPATTTGSATTGTFPAVVEHKHGTTEVAAAPERIVTVGYSDQDFLLAFGVAPIAVTDWYGEYKYATWDWALDELGAAEPVVLNKGAFTGTAAYNYEEIAALDPDLIIGLYVDMSAEQYETLSGIAPTIAPSGDYPEYGMPWQESTRMVGAALGQPERAEELIADVDALFAEQAAAHPEFAGVEAVVAEQFELGSSFARSATDPRTTFITSLGFVLPTEIADLAGDLDGAQISDEQMAVLDHDLLIWNVGYQPELRAEIEAKPLYPQLEVVKAGRSVFIDDPLVSAALTWSTILSIPYALEHVVPQLADALSS